MSLTDDEQRTLDEMEAGLAVASARAGWSHLVAAVAAHWLPVIGMVVIVSSLVTGTIDANPAGIIVAVILSAAAIIGTGWLLWRDARNRAMGD